MAESVVLKAQERKGRGSRNAARLRKEGLVPAVVYGHKEATIAISVPGEDLARAVRHGVRLVDLNLGSSSEKALLREVQWDHLGQDILHVDLARVAADERITVDVRVEIRGTAPGIAAGGALNQPLHTLHVECLAIAIPESIRVNIGELQIDQAIHVRDLKLPEGVSVLNDPEAIVVQVAAPVTEETATPMMGEQAEPEVIGRQKAEKEEGEE